MHGVLRLLLGLKRLAQPIERRCTNLVGRPNVVERLQLGNSRLAREKQRTVEARVVDIARLRMLLDQPGICSQGVLRTADIAVSLAQTIHHFVAGKRLDVPNRLVFLERLGIETTPRQLVGESQTVRRQRGRKLRRERQTGHAGKY